jgi:hypothetical protein
MTIPNITRNNTIDEWRIQTNQSANSLNTLETGNYDKTSGILSIEGTAAVEITVVVPGVVAPIVGCPAPVIQTKLISVPIAKLKVASVGILNCCVAALFIENR